MTDRRTLLRCGAAAATLGIGAVAGAAATPAAADPGPITYEWTDGGCTLTVHATGYDVLGTWWKIPGVESELVAGNGLEEIVLHYGEHWLVADTGASIYVKAYLSGGYVPDATATIPISAGDCSTGATIELTAQAYGPNSQRRVRISDCDSADALGLVDVPVDGTRSVPVLPGEDYCADLLPEVEHTLVPSTLVVAPGENPMLLTLYAGRPLSLTANGAPPGTTYDVVVNQGAFDAGNCSPAACDAIGVPTDGATITVTAVGADDAPLVQTSFTEVDCVTVAGSPSFPGCRLDLVHQADVDGDDDPPPVVDPPVVVPEPTTTTTTAPATAEPPAVRDHAVSGDVVVAGDTTPAAPAAAQAVASVGTTAPARTTLARTGAMTGWLAWSGITLLSLGVVVVLRARRLTATG